MVATTALQNAQVSLPRRVFHGHEHAPRAHHHICRSAHRRDLSLGKPPIRQATRLQDLQPLNTAESTPKRFDEVVRALVGEPGVSPPSRGNNFGSNAFMVNGEIFAMLVRGGIGLKLSRQRVRELIESRQGLPFDASKGKPMKEWVTASVNSDLDWLALARKAMAFGTAG